MDTSSNRLLQVVVALALLNLAPDGHAKTYEGEPINVIGIREPRDFQDPVDEFQPERGDRGGSNDFGGTGVAPDDEEKAMECAAIASKVDSSCDLANPPLMDPNGCGSDGSEHLVPDYLFVNGAPVLRLGPIFSGACNLHDVCYGTHGSDKEACDMILHDDMIEFAQLRMTSTQWLVYGPFVRGQAHAYSAGLQAPFISGLSGEAFRIAQLGGACRYYADKAEKAGCLE